MLVASGTLMARSSDVGYNSVPLAIIINAAVFAASLRVYLHVYSSTVQRSRLFIVFSPGAGFGASVIANGTRDFVCLFPY